MQNILSTFKVLNWNLPNVFHFTELEKLWAFLLKLDLIIKLHVLKQNALLCIMVTKMVIMVIVDKG